MRLRRSPEDGRVAVLSTETLPDVQTSGDTREVPLDEVGVAGLSLPINVAGPDGTQQATVAELELVVALDAEVRGTHMSRLVEEAVSTVAATTPGTALDLARAIRGRLDAPASRVGFCFPLFVDRQAPVSGLTAPQRYEVRLVATTSAVGEKVLVGVRVPVTSLCPCSREISDYGAHSQRGYVNVEVDSPGWSTGQGIWPQELFAYADTAGSAPIYPLLKRVDERSVTMQAYDQPAFVEDIARDVVVAVRADDRCRAWSVNVENHESIHDHQAVASVRGGR